MVHPGAMGQHLGGVPLGMNGVYVGGPMDYNAPTIH